MFTQANCIDYAQEFVRKIISKGINIRFAKLFGSYSKECQSNSSDIDILLVSEEFSGMGFIDNYLIADELIEFDEIQVKTYNIKDYEDSDPLIEEINKTAIELIVN